MAIDADDFDVRQRRAPSGSLDAIVLMSMPNLAFFIPVEMYGWVCGSTSGLTRRLIGAFLPMPAAISFKATSSCSRLDVEHQDAGLERVLDLFFFLADAGKDDFFRIGAGFQRAKQFAAGDDIEAASFLGEDAQQREVGIGFDREADDVRHLGEGLIEDLDSGASSVARL